MALVAGLIWCSWGKFCFYCINHGMQSSRPFTHSSWLVIFVSFDVFLCLTLAICLLLLCRHQGWITSGTIHFARSPRHSLVPVSSVTCWHNGVQCQQKVQLWYPHHGQPRRDGYFFKKHCLFTWSILQLLTRRTNWILIVYYAYYADRTLRLSTRGGSTHIHIRTVVVIKSCLVVAIYNIMIQGTRNLVPQYNNNTMIICYYLHKLPLCTKNPGKCGGRPRCCQQCCRSSLATTTLVASI